MSSQSNVECVGIKAVGHDVKTHADTALQPNRALEEDNWREYCNWNDRRAVDRVWYCLDAIAKHTGCQMHTTASKRMHELARAQNTHKVVTLPHADADRDAVEMQPLAQRWHLRAYARTRAHTCTAKRSSWAGAVDEAATPCEPCDVVNTILPKPAGKRIHLCLF